MTFHPDSTSRVASPPRVNGHRPGSARLRLRVQRGVERPDREALVGGRVEQAFGLGRQVTATALGEHSGDRLAPARAALFELRRVGGRN